MNGQIAGKQKGNMLNSIKEFFSSKYFPFMTAVISLLCYYLGLDIVFIYYVGIAGLIILLTSEDMSPMITLLLFMCVLVSYENSPSNLSGNSDYYFSPAILVQIFIVIGLLSLALFYRLIHTCVRKRFSLSPVFFGLCAFALMLLCNGLFSKNYNPKNLIYGLVMALCFLGIFTLLKDNILNNEDTFERIALSFFALSIVLIVELLVVYTAREGWQTGSIDRKYLSFGWGMWNTMGMMLLICLPATFYLAGKYRYGFIFTLFSALLFIAVWMTTSRQAMLASLIIYPLCLVILIINGNNRIANLIIVICAIAAIAAVLIVFKDTIFSYIKNHLMNIVENGKLSGSGRVELWKGGIKYFESAPILGVGFYSDLYKDFLNDFSGFSGMSFIPHMCHNTVIQLMASCGISGLLAYFIHRVQTVISLFKNLNYNRAFIGVTILTIIGLSLVDNHIFNIFPTIIYSSLVAVLIASEKKDKTLINLTFTN